MCISLKYEEVEYVRERAYTLHMIRTRVNKRKRTLRERFEEKYIPEPNSGCWIWIGSYRGSGYGEMRIDSDYLQRSHRISYQLNVGEIPDGLCILHRCDNPGCVNPKHLFLGTQRINSEDMVTKGRHGTTKLNSEAVKVIKFMYNSGRSLTELARAYKVSTGTISPIIKGKTWKHVCV